jgi:Delta14-sterol reductase
VPPIASRPSSNHQLLTFYTTRLMASEKSKKQLSQASLNPKTTEYEFLGTFGAFFVSVCCPLIVFGLIFLCNEKGCPPQDISTWKYQLPTSFKDFVDWKAIKWYFSFQVALALLWLVLPGKWARGRPLRDGTVLEYKCNGMLIFQEGS